MHIALVVSVSLAGCQIISSTLHDLAGLSVGRLFEKIPVRHFGDAGYLTVDRPARAVIVRRTVLCALVDVGKNAEAQVQVLVEDFPLIFGIGAQILGNELWI